MNKMAYLVRKIIKRERLDELLTVDDVTNMNADIATVEFKTTDGNLSTWIIDSLETLEDAILAIVTTSSQISKMDFMIIDTAILDANCLTYAQTDPGVTVPIRELQNRHYDINNISISKLVNCIKVYKQVVEENEESDDFIVRYVEGEIKDLLNKAYRESRINPSLLNKGIKKVINMDF